MYMLNIMLHTKKKLYIIKLMAFFVQLATEVPQSREEELKGLCINWMRKILAQPHLMPALQLEHLEPQLDMILLSAIGQVSMTYLG